MKKTLLLIAVLLTTVIFSNSFCEKNYEVEKAIIKYKLTGMVSGTMGMTFDKYGKYVSVTTESSEASKTTMIMTPDNTYMIDWSSKTAMDLSAMGGDIMDDSSPDPDIDYDVDAKKIGTEKILGKKASIYLYKPEEGGSIKYWVWKNIMLKSITDMNGMKSTMTATSLKTPSSIPAKTFKIPAGITVQGMPSFSLPIPGFGN